MLEIRLDAHIVDGKIELSHEQQKELANITSGSPVEIIVRADESQNEENIRKRDLLQEMRVLGYESIIDYLIDHPLQIEKFKPLRREEIYSGKRFN